MSSASVDEDNLKISNSPTNGFFLSAQSGNAGGLTWAAGSVADGAITAAKLGADAVTAAKIGDDVINSEHIAADSIDAEHLAPNSVNTDAIVDGSVRNAHIGDDQIDSEHYAAASIDEAHIADDAVTTGKLASGNVTVAKMAANSVDSDQYVDGSIDTEHIADDQVTYAKMQHTATANRLLGAASAGAIGEVQVVVGMMAANSIDSDQYVNGSIDHVHLAADIVDGDIIADDAIDSEHITDGSVDHAHLAGDAVDGDNLADNAVDSEHYTDGSIDTAHIADAQVTLAKTTGLVGKNSIWIPSNAMTPTTSNGCAAIAAVETTSGRPDMMVLDFDKDADEFAQFSVAFPKKWNLGTITFQVFWSGIAATTDCDWSVQGVAMNDNETIDVAYGTAVVVTDNAQGAVEELLVSAESGAVTIAGTPADNDLCYFRIGRDVSGDDMAGDARLHGIKIFFTTDALTDA